jgi:hypothetical protein
MVKHLTQKKVLGKYLHNFENMGFKNSILSTSPKTKIMENNHVFGLFGPFGRREIRQRRRVPRCFDFSWMVPVKRQNGASAN